MDKLDEQLNNIQQEYIPIVGDVAVVAGGIGTVLVLSSLISLFVGTVSMTKSFKVDDGLSKRVNEILNSGSKWVVHVYPERGPNAFSLGFGRHIFVTSALLKLMTDRQIDAILLHEVYHSSKLHTPKRLAFQYPLYYIAAGVAVSAAIMTPIPFAALFAFWLVNNVGNILYNITMGRRHEIKADDFAVQQGYGKDLIEAFKKLEDWVSKRVSKTQCGKICQIMGKIDQAIDEHPTMEARIQNILEAMNKMNPKNLSFAKIKKFVTRMWGIDG